MTPEFTKERDALRATNRQLAEANATLTARLAEFERLQQVWLMSPEAAQRLQGYRDLAGKCAGLEAELDQFRPLVDVLRVERDEARALNTQLAAQVDEARRQRDECAAQIADVRDRLDEFNDAEQAPAECVTAMWQRISEYQVITKKMMAEMTTLWPETHDQARAVLHALATPLEAAVTTHAEAIAAVVNRIEGDLLMARWGDGEGGELTTDEAVALITALLADGRVHSAWLHGRGGK